MPSAGLLFSTPSAGLLFSTPSAGLLSNHSTDQLSNSLYRLAFSNDWHKIASLQSLLQAHFSTPSTGLFLLKPVPTIVLFIEE